MDATRRRVWLSIAAVLAFAGHAAAQSGSDPAPRRQWVDAATLTVAGRGFDDAAGYQRLPERFKPDLPERVWHQSRHAAGLTVHLETDATELHLRWRTGVTTMPHMAANAIMGIDVYADGDPPTYLGTARADPSGAHEAAAVTGLTPRLRRLVLVLPLYERVETLAVGVPAGAAVRAAPAPAGRPIVVYGTSITQGACASRPGMAYPAVLGRRLGRPVVNLGFSGTGRLDPGMVGVLAEIDAAAYVLDCLPNLGPEEVEARATAFVAELRRRRPETPIVLVENPVYPGSAHRPGLAERIAAKNRALARAAAALEAAGVGGLSVLPAEAPTPRREDFTADGIHPTDAGMLRHADRLAEALAPVLADAEPDPAPTPAAAPDRH